MVLAKDAHMTKEGQEKEAPEPGIVTTILQHPGSHPMQGGKKAHKKKSHKVSEKSLNGQVSLGHLTAVRKRKKGDNDNVCLHFWEL